MRRHFCRHLKLQENQEILKSYSFDRADLATVRVMPMGVRSLPRFLPCAMFIFYPKGGEGVFGEGGVGVSIHIMTNKKKNNKK